MGVLKGALIVFNVIFICIGLAAIGFGAWGMIDKDFINNLSRATEDNADSSTLSFLEAGSIAIIVGGAIIFIIALLGCCGAWKESKCVLGIYLFFLILILAIELAAIGIVVIFRKEAESGLKENLVEKLQKEYDGDIPPTNDWNKAIDSAQQAFKCCGVNNYTDYHNGKWLRGTGQNKEIVPKMCCKLKEDKYPDSITLEDENCMKNPSDTNSYWDKGCYDAVLDELKSRSLPVIIIGAIVCGIEVFCIILAIALCCTLRREDKIV